MAVKASKRCLLLSLIACVTIVAIVAVVAVVVSNKDDKNDVIPQDSKFITVRTKLGIVQGKVHQVVKDDGESTEVFEFPNIPYARPPVNGLRWRPPVTLNASTSWKGVLEYTKKEVWCKQKNLRGENVGQEDCLILTVRQPSSANKNNFLPVLFWIHGGGLLIGSSYSYYPGEQCSASLEMVTVSINYRLNVFGFLSIKELWQTSGPSGDNNFGNYGILDMIVALQWVRDNIQMFGGDPEKVTILGESGGGAAVFSLITSPLAAGLFHKAIPASGYPVSVENDYQRANRVYGHLFKNDTGCLEKSTDAKAIAECLRNLTADQVIANQFGTKDFLAKFSPWIFPTNERTVTDLFHARVLDPVVLPQPIGMLTRAHVTGLEILIGTCAQEAFSLKEAETWAGLKKYITPKIDGFSPNLYPELLKLYRESRVQDKVTPQNVTSQYVYTIMTSDVILSCQTNDIAQNLSRISNTTVYRYVESQPLSKSIDSFPPTAYHSADTVALFQTPGSFTQGDAKLSANMRKFVKDFVYGTKEFRAKYHGKVAEFWDDKIVTWDKPYHEKECKVLRDNGFLKRAWGQLG